MAASGKRICVIGAGVSGLTTAISLRRAGYDVAIVTSGTREATTSSAAAAFWYPFWTGREPVHDWYLPEWAMHSYFEFEKLIGHDLSGVTEITLREYFDANMTTESIHKTVDSMWWRFLPQLNFGAIPTADLESLSCTPPTSAAIRFSAGIRFRTFVINMAAYLPFLEALATGEGCRLEPSTRITQERTPGAVTVSDLLRQYPCVVNCAGLGARETAGEKHLVPTQGVVVKLAPSPHIKELVLMHTGHFFERLPFYIVPRGGPSPDILLGGTIRPLWDHPGETVHHSWPSPDDEVQHIAGEIVETCKSFSPELGDLSIRDVSVGYRPAREIPDALRTTMTAPFGVRLEPDGNIVHNYGHGGGGVTFSWGCAKRVVELVDRLTL